MKVCLGSGEEEIQTPGEDIGVLEARVTSGCGLPWMGAGTELGSSARASVQPSLRSIFWSPALHCVLQPCCSESFWATLPSLPLISPLGRWDYSRRLRCSAFCVDSGAQPQLTRPAQQAYLPTEPWDISPALFPRKSFTTELGRNPQLGRLSLG